MVSFQELISGGSVLPTAVQDVLSQFLLLEVCESWDGHLTIDSGGFISSHAKYTDILLCRLADQSPPSL